MSKTRHPRQELELELATLRRRVAELESESASARQAEAEREKLILELQAAFHTVRTLRGLHPICAACKKIRDDSGYWHQVESYLQSHTDVEFSHGICPDCMERLYPEFPGEALPDRSRAPIP